MTKFNPIEIFFLIIKRNFNPTNLCAPTVYAVHAYNV